MKKVGGDWISTTVEITIGYLTWYNDAIYTISTTVEITIGYLTYTYYIHTLSYLQQ